MTRAALLLLLAVGCSAPPRAFVTPQGPYGKALGEATRAVTIYRGLESTLVMYATWESPDFRAARSEKLAQVYDVVLEAEEVRGGELTRPVDGHAFFVAIHTRDRAANDLERDDSQWALVLEGPDGRAAPAKVERFARTVTGLDALYPHADRFFVPYRVTFPDTVGARPLRLTISGPLGRAEVAF